MAAKCACCSKPLKPFPVPSGPWSGSFKEFQELPQIQPDNGFVCENCNKIICPVCSGKKASQLNVRQFVCTECGHMPLKTIYRKK